MEIGHSHLIAALASTPWCMRAEMFKTFETVLNNKFTLGLNVTQLKQDDFGSAKKGNSASVKKGVAVVKMHGTLLKKAYCMDTASGGTRTLEDVQRDLRNAYSDPEVGGILLDIESGGGGVPGTAETARLIADIKETKPVIGLAGGYMCSGAYWIGSACSELYCSNTTEVGSIGVYQTHISMAKVLEEEGIKVTLIKAGKQKALGNQYTDLTEEDLSILQQRIDNLYNIFMSEVAGYRGVSFDKVKSEWADARLFTGEEAVRAGLVDDIATVDEILNSF